MASSQDSLKANDGLKVVELTRNAIKTICEGEGKDEVKKGTFIVQAIEVKTFTQQDNKKNIK